MKTTYVRIDPKTIEDRTPLPQGNPWPYPLPSPRYIELEPFEWDAEPGELVEKQ